MPALQPGLGSQIRRLIDLLDDAVSEAHDYAGLHYRPRYTPVMKALASGAALTIGQIADAARITQPAATQTVALMVKDGFVDVAPGLEDARQRVAMLTKAGRALMPRLEAAWQATDRAAESLDAETALSLAIQAALVALERKSFGERIRDAREAADLSSKRKKTR